VKTIDQNDDIALVEKTENTINIAVLFYSDFIDARRVCDMFKEFNGYYF
jgi:hypothetical protein